MTHTATISGWGNHLKRISRVFNPSSLSSLQSNLLSEPSLIPRGMGRSYGDSANASTVLQTSYLDHFLSFDEKTGLLTAEAGVTLRDLLNVTIKKGWFLAVTPGTSYVTLGGAIASDVHGKNHHHAGTFGQHVKSITMLLGTGEIITVSPELNSDLFHATCGGMGLTGMIISATIQLIPIRSTHINQQTIKAKCIEEACEAFEDNFDSTYSVAWIDCLAKGKNLGRSVLFLGEHSESGNLDLKLKDPINIPVYTPAALLNHVTMKSFNNTYWYKAKHNNIHQSRLLPYFYPLDSIGSWNKLYGKAGFIQYQFVLPKQDGVKNMRTILSKIAKNGQGSFLAVLKLLGKENKNLLSFPLEGYTLALDFKVSESTIKMIHQLDEMILSMGGRVYLTKDAVMRENTFKSSYSNWQLFESVREKYSAFGKFGSDQSKRLGLS